MTDPQQIMAAFNGIDGETGAYLWPPMRPEDMYRLARGLKFRDDRQQELLLRHHRDTAATYMPKEGVDARNLAEAGWGVIFAAEADPAIREALEPLLSHRREQAGALKEHRYREFTGEDGVQTGESKRAFLARHGVGPGSADPDRMPYYLLIVGNPQEIPFDFQYLLDVQYAVGRISFDRADQYASYARSVVAAERSGTTAPLKIGFAAPANPNDRATALTSTHLAAPLASAIAEGNPQVEVKLALGEDSTKQRMLSMLGGDDAVRLLFTAGHGVGFRTVHPRQRAWQGALVTQEWPGPGTALRDEHVIRAGDISDEANLHGLIAFHFACYGAGTPRCDNFPTDRSAPKVIAEQPFMAALPMRLLSHERAGALAVVSHIDRAWGYSFLWPGAGRQTEVFRSCLAQLIKGDPIGYAFEHLNARYAELSTELLDEEDRLALRGKPDPLRHMSTWTARNDARNFVILGDPAVRLACDGGQDGVHG